MRYSRWLRSVLISALLVAVSVMLVFSSASAHGNQKHATSCDSKQALCQLLDPDATLIGALEETNMPTISKPAWMTPKPKTTRPNTMTVTYRVETRGVVRSGIESFAAQAAETYADARGWKGMGVTFQRVQSGGQFVLVLSQAALMTTFSATGCDTTYSCNVGQYVIINDDRWQGATTPWNQNGGSLRDYRHMVVNHETGHWLGHGHRSCGGAGQPAPVMQQQSINLQGCRFNPWPTSSEMFSPTLGITL